MDTFLYFLTSATVFFGLAFMIGWGASRFHFRKERERFRYVGIIHKGSDTYRLTFPDFPVLATVADSLGLLHHNAEVVLRFHLETLLEEGRHPPKPTTPQICFPLLEDLPEAIGFWVIRVEL